jgi:3-oxoadipate enol-lactonase
MTVPVTHAGDIEMYYELHGSGEPLVIIGGLASDISQWGWLTDWCAQTSQVLAFDNRGAGRTDKPDAPYTIPMMAGDTDALMESVGMSHATVLGISMGGRIALDLALEHPARVARLILVSTSASARPETSTSRMEMLSMLSSLVFRGKYPQPRYAFARQRQASRAYDCADRLDQIHVPTTILHGRRDRIVTLRDAEAMRRGITGSQFVTFGGGHLFFLVRERKWFLDTVASTLAARSSLPAS